jgi:hypothetical protein
MEWFEVTFLIYLVRVWVSTLMRCVSGYISRILIMIGWGLYTVVLKSQ